MVVLSAVLVLLILSFFFGTCIVVFGKIFEIKKHPLFDAVYGVLPSYNCGACGYSGCTQYAEALLKDHVHPYLCTPGGQELAQKLRKMLESKPA